MADEITIFSGIRCVNGSLSYQGANRSFTADQATGRFANFTQDIGTSEESISFGDVVPGWVRVTNLDGTNYVTIRFTTSAAAGIKVLPGESTGPFLLSGSGLYAIANTAACKIQIEAANV